jgi:hypothetical protein
MSTPLLHRTLSTRLVRGYRTHYELPQQQYPLLELHQGLSLQVSPLQSLENVKSLLLSVARSKHYRNQIYQQVAVHESPESELPHGHLLHQTKTWSSTIILPMLLQVLPRYEIRNHALIPKREGVRPSNKSDDLMSLHGT